MFCPVCKEIELKISDRKGIEIDYCPRCRGIWLDRGELDKLIERSAAYENTAQPMIRDRDDDDDMYFKRKRGYADDDENRHPSQRPSKRRTLLSELLDVFD